MPKSWWACAEGFIASLGDGLPGYNVESGVSVVYCLQHAENSRLNVTNRLSSHHPCQELPNYNAEGIKCAVVCRKCAEGGIMDVGSEHCWRDVRTSHPRINVQGSNARA